MLYIFYLIQHQGVCKHLAISIPVCFNVGLYYLQKTLPDLLSQKVHINLL